MASYKSEGIRNIALVGHSSAGKTTLAEALLHAVGVTGRLGVVEDGSTVSDYDPEEKERTQSIDLSVMHVDHEGERVNLLDAPGAPDFVSGALSSLMAADTAVVVISAGAGIEVNTRRMFQTAKASGLGLVIVVNKCDAENLDLPALLGTIQESFGNHCLPINLPDAAGPGFSAVADVMAGEGQSGVADVSEAHTKLLEAIVENDETLMEKYFEGEDLDPAAVAATLQKAIASDSIVPICFTSARGELGVRELLDVVVRYCPAPGAIARSIKVAGEEGARTEPVDASADGPLRAQVFRVATGLARGRVAYLRVLGGTLTAATSFYRNDDRKPQKAGHLFSAQGEELVEADDGIAGDLVAVARLDDLQIGDLLHEDQGELTMARPKYPTPMYSVAIEPKSRGDEQKISEALRALADEDPCFHTTRDRQTNEMVISGLGDLHLRVVLSRLARRRKVEVDTKPPKIPYRETILGNGDAEYTHKKQTGGAGQYARVFLKVEPLERGSDPPLEFVNEVFGGSIPGQFIPAVEKGVREAMELGCVGGYPVQDVKVAVYDGKHHPVDSKEIAFKTAGRQCFREAMAMAKPVILEPIVDLEITVPNQFTGDITGDMASRRGRIMGMDSMPGGLTLVRAQVPLAEVLQYNSQLRSVTGGQGSYSMEFSHYDPVPGNIQKQLTEAYKPREEE